MSYKLFEQSMLQQLWRPNPGSHKGENGRVLVIGGSQLFHASIFWSADVASKVVDLVHFCSPSEENNELVRYQLKRGFWNGIVVPWKEVRSYIAEDDVILIGPGMPRVEGLAQGERETGVIVNELLRDFGDKKWVIDGGALQEVDVSLLGASHLVTPHEGELRSLVERVGDADLVERWEVMSGEGEEEKQLVERIELLQLLSERIGGATILAKNKVDVVIGKGEVVAIGGGNQGLTKGGTGDVLAGLTTALYAKNEAYLAAAAASYAVKQVGERLFERVGYYYNSSDVVHEVGAVWRGFTS